MNTNNLTYFITANSCYGYSSFFPSLLKQCQRHILFENSSETFRSDLFNNIIGFCKNNNIFYHQIMQAGYSEKLCGMYFPNSSALVFCIPFFKNVPNGFSATIVCPKLTFADAEKISSLQSESERLKEDMYSHLASAKKIHDDWEKIYISNMDFSKADNASNDFIYDIFKNHDTGKPGINCDRFFGSMLSNGSVNYIDNITAGLEKRVFIKGRPGTGKSTFLKKIRSAALERGFDTETYYCSFDPHSLDMVVVRDLSLCVFDSTSPHEMFPSKETDSIFDIYEIAVTPGTDEKYSHALESIKVGYDIEMAKAKKLLSGILSIHQQADNIYSKYSVSADDLIRSAMTNIL